MKKTLLIISLTILTLTSVKSQDKIQFGVKGGLNFTNMTSDDILDKESQTGFHIGALAEIPLGTIFSLQPEIIYSTYGANGKVLLDGFSSLVRKEYNFDYIQVPLLAKIYIIKNLSLEIGPSFNFLVDEEYILNSKTYINKGEKFEFSGILGVSYKTNSDFFGSIRYTNSFTNALESDYRDDKNYSFLFGIGYLF